MLGFMKLGTNSYKTVINLNLIKEYLVSDPILYFSLYRVTRHPCVKSQIVMSVLHMFFFNINNVSFY